MVTILFYNKEVELAQSGQIMREELMNSLQTLLLLPLDQPFYPLKTGNTSERRAWDIFSNQGHQNQRSINRSSTHNRQISRTHLRKTI